MEGEKIDEIINREPKVLSTLRQPEKIVYVEVHENNKIYVKFPKESIEETKTILMGGNSIGEFKWEFLRSISKKDYIICIINSQAVLIGEGNYKYMTDEQYFGIQVFELVLGIVDDENRYKLVFPHIAKVGSIDIFKTYVGEINRRYNNFRMSIWDKNLVNSQRLMDTNSRNINRNRFELAGMVSYYEVHKAIFGISNIPYYKILETINNKYDAEEITKDISLKTYINYQGVGLNTIVKEVEKNTILTPQAIMDRNMDAIIRVMSKTISIYFNTEGLKLEELYTLRMMLIMRVCEQTSGKIVITKICSVDGGLNTEWYISDDTIYDSAKQIIKGIYNNILRNIQLEEGGN